jgi:hypothetical protein
MAKKQLIAGATGLAVVGILSYLGYRLFKELNDMTFDDFIGENIDDEYHYRTTDYQCQQGTSESSKP